MLNKYFIDLQPVNTRKETPYRRYEVTAAGNSIDQLIEDAWVYEVDQYGEEITNYALLQSGAELYVEVVKLIKDFVVTQDKEEYIAS